MNTIAELLSVRKQRLSLQREADLLEEQEKKMTGEIIDYMIGTKLGTLKQGEDEAILTHSEEPMVNPGMWPVVLDYIVETGAVDLLQKRLTASAVKARWADGEVVVGIEKVRKYTLKFNV